MPRTTFKCTCLLLPFSALGYDFKYANIEENEMIGLNRMLPDALLITKKREKVKRVSNACIKKKGNMVQLIVIFIVSMS